jgi:tetratricopeptide (TPR) repeat protein
MLVDGVLPSELGYYFLENGNAILRQGKPATAIQYYTMARSCCEKLHNPTVEDKTLLTKANINIGLTCNKYGDYKRAVVACTKALNGDKVNVKGLTIRGIARMNLQRFDAALEDLNEAVNISNYQPAQFYLKKCLNKRRWHRSNLRKLMTQIERLL